MSEIIPAILAASLEEVRANLEKVRGAARWAQLDVCDGFFVPARTWPMNPSDRTSFEQMVKGETGLPFWEDFNFDIDLMVQNPEKVIPQWVSAGASRIAIHIEAKHDYAACRAALGDATEFGIALVNDTPLSRLEPLRGSFYYMQLLGNAVVGKQGQPFDERVLVRIQEAKKLFPDVTIQIDGAVNGETAPRLIEAGATRLVCGSYILRAEDPKAVIKELQQLS